MASPQQVYSDYGIRTAPVHFNKGPEFYQRELGISYLDHLLQGRGFTRFSLNGNEYELRDATANDISNVALMDGQMNSLFIQDMSSIRRLIAIAEKPDIPIGFYLGRQHQEHPKTLEMFFYYVSPKNRGKGIGSVQRADLLLSALNMEGVNSTLSIQRPISNFYRSLNDISSELRKSGSFFYEIDLRDREKARQIIEQRLKELGINPIN